jgi:hypothetical protein
LFALDAGQYQVSGQVLTALANHLLNLASGQYLLSGSDAGLLSARLIVLDTGIYLYTGADANLIYAPSGNKVLNLEPGMYVLSGAALTFIAPVPIPTPIPIVVGGSGGYGVEGRYARKVSLAEWWTLLWGRRLPKLQEATTLEEAVAETEDDLLALLMGL